MRTVIEYFNETCDLPLFIFNSLSMHAEPGRKESGDLTSGDHWPFYSSFTHQNDHVIPNHISNVIEINHMHKKPTYENLKFDFYRVTLNSNYYQPFALAFTKIFSP